MQSSKPFARAIAMMGLISAAMSMPQHMQQAKLAQIGAYESRGKGGKRAHRSVGTRANTRAAAKARNVRRFRAANR